MLEAIARVAGFQAGCGPQFEALLIEDAQLGWVCKPDETFHYLATDGWVKGTTDQGGFRPVVVNRERVDLPIVICLGDSTTFCAEVSDQNTWPEAAATAMVSHGHPCRMVNRGVRGYSTVQCLLTLRKALGEQRLRSSTQAVIYHFCINDPSENFEISRPSLVGPKALPIAPPIRSKEPDSTKAIRRAILKRSAAYTMIRSCTLATDSSSFKAGGIAGYGFTFHCFCDFLSDEWQQRGTRQLLGMLATECKAAGVKLYVSTSSYPPWDGDGIARTDYMQLTGLSREAVIQEARMYGLGCDLLAEMVHEVGGVFIDIRGCLEGMTHREYAASPLDWHFSAAANERVGKAIAAGLEKDFRDFPRMGRQR